MRRTFYNADHEASARPAAPSSRRRPHFNEWHEAGIVPKDFYLKLGKLGAFGIEVPEEYGGDGESSFKYSAILQEEIAEGMWHLAAADYSDVFGDHPLELWRKVLRRQKGELAFFSTWVENPELN